MKQSGLWSSLGTHGSLWLYGDYVFPIVLKPDKFDSFLSQISPWRSIAPQTIGISTNLFFTSDLNLVILAWMDDELWCRQAQNGINFDFEVKFDIEGQGRLPPKTIGTLRCFASLVQNLVGLAWTADELGRIQWPSSAWPLTPWGMSDGPYHVTTQFYFCKKYKIQSIFTRAFDVAQRVWFRQLSMFWMWRHHMALWRHGGGALQWFDPNDSLQHDRIYL